MSNNKLKNALNTIKSIVEEKDHEILYLKTQNKLLRDSAYKDLELERMKKERDEALHLMYQGFPLKDEEINRCGKWVEGHKKEHNGKYSNHYNYIFTVNGLCAIGKIQCGDCKEEYRFTEDYQE